MEIITIVISTVSAFVLGLIVWAVSMSYIRKQMPLASKKQIRSAGILAALITIGSIMAHELAHAGVGMALGISITDIGLIPLGGYVIFSTSLTDVAPFAEFSISIAGPLMNLLIAGIAAVLVKIYGESLKENTIQFVSVINFELGIINLLPIFLLDGGKAVDGVLRVLLIVFNADQNIAFYCTMAVGIIFLSYWFSEKHKKININNRFAKYLERL